MLMEGFIYEHGFYILCAISFLIGVFFLLFRSKFKKLSFLVILFGLFFIVLVLRIMNQIF